MCVCPVKLDQKPPFSVSLSVSQSLSVSLRVSQSLSVSLRVSLPTVWPSHSLLPEPYCQSPIVMPESNATAPIHRERGSKVYTRCTVRAPPCTLQRCALQTPDRNWTPLSVSLAEQRSQRWQQSLRDFLFVGATAVSVSTS